MDTLPSLTPLPALCAINGRRGSRLFNVSAHAWLSLRSLVLANGFTAANGAAVFATGPATLRLSDCVVAGHAAMAALDVPGTPGNSGGAIFLAPAAFGAASSGHVLRISSTLFRDNVAAKGSDLYASAGADVLVERSSFNNSNVLTFEGVVSGGGSMFLEDCPDDNGANGTVLRMTDTIFNNEGHRLLLTEHATNVRQPASHC